MTPEEMMAMDPEMAATAAAGMMGAVMIFYVVAYVWTALCLYFIAKKTNTANPWMAWVPIANVFLMLNIAKRPLWWFVLMLIPLVNFVILIIVMMDMIKARGRPAWHVVLMLLFGPIYMGYLAFSS